MNSFSCVVIGEDALLIGCGDTLIEHGHEIRAVISEDTDIRSWAQDKALPVYPTMNHLIERFENGAFDWLFSITNQKRIPDAVLALPTRGTTNYHDAPLPRYAGINAPVWALINRETRHGVAWHMVRAGDDNDDIVGHQDFDISSQETAYSLSLKCFAAGLDSFGTLLKQLGHRTVEHVAQDLSHHRYFAREDRPDAAGRLDFSKPAEELAAQVRALDFGPLWNPMMCAKVEILGRVLLVRRADLVDRKTAAQPGTVLERDAKSLVVATGQGALCIEGFSTTDGKPVDLTSFVETGRVLPTPDAALRALLNHNIRRCVISENHWRRALQNMHPITVPLARGDATVPNWASRTIELNPTLIGSPAIAAVMAWALRSSGQDVADLAFCDAPMAQAARDLPGYVNGWVPLQVCCDETLATTVARLERALDHVQMCGGFACDLIARDPLVTKTNVPAVGVALGFAEPIPDTILTVALSGDNMATLFYDRTRITEPDADLLLARLKTLLGVATRNATPANTIGQLQALPAAERHLVLSKWNEAAKDHDREQTVHGAIEDQIARTPDATAFVFEDTHLSFAELDHQANLIATRLQALGASRGSHVGLYLPASPDAVIAALAILKAGATCVPLDPSDPADRIAFLASDSAAQVIVTRSDIASDLPPLSVPILCVDGEEPADATRVDGGATATDLAYLIYTSGATGTPKGVMIEHRNICHMFAGLDDHIECSDAATWVATNALPFDVSMPEIFYALARGFKVVLCDQNVGQRETQSATAVPEQRIDFSLFYWGNDGGSGPQKYDLLLEGAKFADANDFNAVWTPERHFQTDGGAFPNPAVTGAAVAAVTQNVSVRAGSCVAPLHHPARIAEDWAMIDNLTNGRTGLAIASGWQGDDFVLRPENAPPYNKSAMYAAIQQLRRLWRGEAVEFPSRTGRMIPVVTQPRPVSTELPIWVTTVGNPDTWQEAGRIGAHVLTHLLGQSIDDVAGKIEIYHAALREAGYDPLDFNVTVMLHTYLSDDRNDAANAAREPMKRYLRNATGLIKQYAWDCPAFERPEGAVKPYQIDLSQISEADMDLILDFAFDRYFDQAGLFGTPKDGLERITQLRSIGVTEIACLVDFGIPAAKVMAGLRPLADLLQTANAAAKVEGHDFSLAAQIIRHKATHLRCTPRMVNDLIGAQVGQTAIIQVRQLILGGETLSSALVEALQPCTNARILNLFGTIETTMVSTVSDASANTCIGRSIANTRAYVLDTHGQPVPIGVTGELHIAGPGVARGYWQRHDLSEAHFPPDPFAETSETQVTVPRMARTGDLVRWQTDGTIELLGRADRQMKIKGHRIDPGEVEANLRDFSRVTDAIVIPHDVGEGRIELVAFITTSAPVAQDALTAHLQNHLPDVMIPTRIEALDHLPPAQDDDIDSLALRRAAPPAESSTPHALGQDAIIRAIWCHQLGMSDIDVDENVFVSGATPVQAARVCQDIRKAMNVPKLTVLDVFQNPTVRGLSEFVTIKSDATRTSAMVPNAATPCHTEHRARRARTG